MTFEALTPSADTALLEQFQTQINSVEQAKESLKQDIEKAEKSQDWSLVQTAKVVLQQELSQAKATQRKVEGKGADSEISAEYTYKNEKGKEVTETIELDFETEFSTMTDFYQKHGIEIPADFAEQMRDIWEENADSISEAMAEKGFNQVLFIPADVPSPKDLEAKMTAGYEKEKGNKTWWGIKAEDIVESSGKTARIVLVHNAPDLTAQPELKKTLGKKYGGEREDGKDNKAEDFIKEGETLSLSEYLLLQRLVFERTGVHLDSKKTPDGSYIYYTWLPGSRVGSGVVYASWDPGFGQLNVCAVVPGGSGGSLGCRPSRCFKKK